MNGEQGVLDPPEFLIDSNCLMDPFNKYYGPKFSLSKGFWDPLSGLVKSGSVGILDVVRNEVLNKENPDELDEWLKDIDSYVISTKSSRQIVSGYADVINFLGTQGDLFRPSALMEWSVETVADPWLIAAANYLDATVVTFEKYVPVTPNQPAGKPKIPTVAKFFDVQCATLFEFMRVVPRF
jgi:hypothetical protein